MNIKDCFPNQSDLAEIIKREDEVTDRDRVRAHRIWHGAKPKDEEMLLIFQASKGKVTANDFYNLPNSASSINKN